MLSSQVMTYQLQKVFLFLLLRIRQARQMKINAWSILSADQLSNMRVAAGLTRQAIANAVGVSLATMSSWENNKHAPSNETQALLLELFKNKNLLSVMSEGLTEEKDGNEEMLDQSEDQQVDSLVSEYSSPGLSEGKKLGRTSACKNCACKNKKVEDSPKSGTKEHDSIVAHLMLALITAGKLPECNTLTDSLRNLRKSVEDSF